MSETKAEFIDAVTQLAESLYDFHERFGIEGTEGAGRDVILEVFTSRLPFLIEEIGEHASAINRADDVNATEEMADILYIVLGTLVRLGRRGNYAMTQVAEKNNQKTTSTHRIEPLSGKLIRLGNLPS